jgi:hypothetical protein
MHTSRTNSIFVPNKSIRDMICLFPTINFRQKGQITLSIKTHPKINQGLQQLFPSNSKRPFQTKCSQGLLSKKIYVAFLHIQISHSNAELIIHPSSQSGTTPVKRIVYRVRSCWNIADLKSTRECLQTCKSFALRFDIFWTILLTKD